MPVRSTFSSKSRLGEVQASPTENTLLERQKALETAITAINTLIGAIGASPTENTVMDRLKEVEDGIDETKVLIGAVAVSPTENTLLERQKAIETALTAINTLIGAISATPTENTAMDRLKEVEDGIDEVKVLIGAVTASPTENTLLERLKALETTLLTLVVLGAGTNIIGNVRIDQTTPGTTNKVAVSAVKTIQSELLAITAIAANLQQKSSELALTGIKKATVFIDHGRTATTAFVVAGTEYRIEASQQATGDDTWRTIASVEAIITAATEITADAQEVAGQTLIEIGANTPAVGDIVFWENATLANSEWMKVVAITGGTDFTILDGLTNTQELAKKIYNKAEQFVLTLDVEAFTRLRVVVNNNNGTTNVAIKSRIACITEV